MKQDFKDTTTQNTEMLSRGEAIKKIGGYAALTALGTFMILNPQKAQAQSAPPTLPCFPSGSDPCQDGCPDTFCDCAGCVGQDEDGDCTGCATPFQGDGNNKSNTTDKINFDSKYKSKYTKK